MVTPILKCNSINNPLIISTGIGDFEFSHSLGRKQTFKQHLQLIIEVCDNVKLLEHHQLNLSNASKYIKSDTYRQYLEYLKNFEG